MLARKFIISLLIVFITSRQSLVHLQPQNDAPHRLASAEFVQWDHNSIDVSKGDSFNITCRASLHSYFDVVRVQVVYDHGINQTISDGKDVKKPFSKMERLKILHSVENQNVFQTTLMFSDPRGEDSGTYSCLRLGDPKVASVHLHVHIPIKSVVWSNQPMPPDDLPTSGNEEMVTLKLKEAEDSSVSCIVLVDGAVDSPNIRVLLNGEEDVTSYFTEFEGPRMIQDGDGQVRLQSVTRLTYSTLHPAPLIHGHNLTCVAEVRGGDHRDRSNGSFDVGQMSASALVSVEYAPIFTCQKYFHLVRVRENVSVECLLYSNPQSILNWSRSVSQSGQPEVRLSQKKIGLNKYRVRFEVVDVEEPDMGTYHLLATNDIASQEVALNFSPLQPFRAKEPEGLVRFDALTGSTSSQYSILSTIFLLLFSVFFCIILH